MESRQGQPEGPYKIEKDDCRRIYRDVVIQALRDLGSYNRLERSAVLNWMVTDSFLHCCILAEWDDQWLLDLFKSLAKIDDSVRKQISTQCVHGLKFICRLESQSGYLTLSSIEESSSGSRRQSRSDPGDYEGYSLNEAKTYDTGIYGLGSTRYRYYSKKK